MWPFRLGGDNRGPGGIGCLSPGTAFHICLGPWMFFFPKNQRKIIDVDRGIDSNGLTSLPDLRGFNLQAIRKEPERFHGVPSFWLVKGLFLMVASKKQVVW